MSHSTVPVLLLVVILMLQKLTEAIDCNPPIKGCVCSKTKVSCYQLTDFPLSFPHDTTHIVLDDMSLYDIPSGAFSKLPHLTRIEMTRVNAGVIQGCAFKDLPSLKKLDIKLSVFGEIQKMAFWNTSQDLILIFKDCRITKINSYAFMKLKNIKSWLMHNVKVEEIQQNAFSDISHINSSFIWEDSKIKMIDSNAFHGIKEIGRVVIRGNNFTSMSCGSLDDLMTSSKNVDLSGNNFKCDCSIVWLIKQRTSNPLYKELTDQATCTGPDQYAGVAIKDLGLDKKICATENEAVKTGCNKPGIPLPEFKCPNRRLPDGVTERPDPNNPGGAAGKTDLHGLFLLLMLTAYSLLL